MTEPKRGRTPRPPRIVTLTGVKGGSGKSVATLTLAEGLARLEGARVLVIDADQQASVSGLLFPGSLRELEKLRSRGVSLAGYIGKLLGESGSLQDHAIANCSNASDIEEAGGTIFLVPGGTNLRAIEQELSARRPVRKASALVELPSSMLNFETICDDLRQGISEFCSAHKVELVLVDTQAGMGPIAELFSRISDVVILPCVPDDVSMDTIKVTNSIITNDLGSISAQRYLLFSKVQIRLDHGQYIKLVTDRKSHDKDLKGIEIFEAFFSQANSILALPTYSANMQPFAVKYDGVAGNILRVARELAAVIWPK